MPGNGDLVDLGAESFQNFGCSAHAGVDVRMRIVLPESFLHDADFQPGDALADRLGIGVELEAVLA